MTKHFIFLLIFSLTISAMCFAYKIDEYSPAYIIVTVGSERVKLYSIPLTDIEFGKDGIFFYDSKGKRINSDQIILYQGLYFMTKVIDPIKKG